MLDKPKVGKAISEQRKQKGMTQKQLADLLHVSYQAVSRWEQGISLPSVDIIYHIAQILETTVDSLLSGLKEEPKVIRYIDTGLDIQKLYTIKERLNSLITKDKTLLHAKYIDPIFFKPDTTGMEDPVYVLANHVPGSKERFAMENGYDQEICTDLVASTSNNLARFGIKPLLLHAHMVCGNNDSGQILLMGEAFKHACEKDNITFAGLEVAAQAVNYPAGQYNLNASAIGIADKKTIITGDQITEGDTIIGLAMDGISSLSYPFIKIIIDRKPDILYARIDRQTTLMDQLMKPNTSYTNVIQELKKQQLLHGIFSLNRSLFRRRCFDTMPKGLGACLSLSSLPLPPLFQYLYSLGMMNRQCFLENFSLGIGMLLVIPASQCARALHIIKKHHPCHIMGTIKKDTPNPDAKVWREGTVTW